MILDMKPIRSVFSTLTLVVGIFLFALLVDQIKPLKQLDAYLKEHPQPYSAITLILLLLGCALLASALWIALTNQGRPMSEGEANEFISRGARPGWQVGVFSGKAAGREAKLEASFYDIREAFLSGAWLRDPTWWPICFGTIGPLLAMIGAFGYFFIIGAPAVKVIVGTALVYALVRTAWGFAKA